MEDLGLRAFNSRDQNKSDSLKGIRLPNNLSPNSISILAEPQNSDDYDHAIILVSSTPVYAGDELAYATFQLQAIKNSKEALSLAAPSQNMNILRL